MQRSRATGIAAVTLGVGIALNAVLGPLVLGVIKIRESASMENQLLGGELTSLVLAAPLAVVAGILWMRGHRLAPMLTIGPAGFAVYTYVQFVLVPDYSRYAGNNEQWFPLYLLLVILGWGLVWRSWQDLARDTTRVPASIAPLLGTSMLVVSATFALAWVGSIAGVMTGRTTAEYLEHPTGFWLIRLMDLGFVIPIGMLAGCGLLGRRAWASSLTRAFVGTQTLLACAVAGMAVRMWAKHDPAVTPVLLFVSVTGAALFAVAYALLLRNPAVVPAEEGRPASTRRISGHLPRQVTRR